MPGLTTKPTLANRRPPISVVVLAVPPVEELDLIGPLEVFAGVNRALGERGPAYDIRLVSAQPKPIIAGECGVSLLAHGYYRRLRQPVDTLVVVGGLTSKNTRDSRLSLWLQKMAGRVRRVASVCVGAFFLAEAGLLHNKRATTHWAFASDLQKKYPDVKVDANPIWIQDGNIYTSAGVTAGIDLALAMVEEDQGASLALDVARGLIVFLRRPGSQAQFSVSLSTQASGRTALHDLQVWMAENLNNDLSVDALARRAAMSPRNFSRVFRKETGITPAKFAERLRVEAARRQLEQTVRAVKEIAASCGFSSSEIMRRTFLSQLQVTPSAYRLRFQRHSPSRTSRVANQAEFNQPR
jgi:transcriptional regulator GlxA family with amidase domain